MKLNRLIGMALSAMLTTPAMSETATQTMTVNATLVATCIINTSGFRNTPAPAVLNFGVLTIGSGARADTTGAVPGQGGASVICSNGVPWTLIANGGGNLSGTQRQISDGTTTIPYNLYNDSSYTSLIGIDDPANPVASGTGNGSTQLTPIYGEITPDTPVPIPGNYSDSVTLTVNY
ncbi:Csu type fimbrial protein [Salmonella enterica]